MFEKREAASLENRRQKFVTLGKKKYGNQYDYSLAIKKYTNNREPVPLICTQCNNAPFLVYPFAHTSNGKNQKGTCPHCYVPKQTVQETRWDPNLEQRIKEFKKVVDEKYAKAYTYPFLVQEYKNEESYITVQCTVCDTEPFRLKARSLKSKSRHGGCKVCNKAVMAHTIAEKNSERLKRNHETKDQPREYGCIYQITNIQNGDFYIGYTTMGADKRFKAHKDESLRLARGHKKAKSYLHNAMNHYGRKSFSVKILEEFSHVSPIYLGEKEIAYIDKLNPQYNVSKGGELGHYKTAN